MLLSVPLTMIVKIALESGSGTKWLALLLSGDDDDMVDTPALPEKTSTTEN